MGLYGVADGLPYDQWPNEALLRLQEDLGRNGSSEAQERISEEVAAVLKSREEAGVRNSDDGDMTHRV